MKKSKHREVVIWQKAKKRAKDQTTAKSKKWFGVEKIEAFRAKILGLGQSKTFLTSGTKKAFIKLRQAFVKVPTY